MSSTRLPVVGGAPSPAPDGPALGPREPCTEPTVVVVGAASTITVAPFVRAREEALAKAGARAVVSTRTEQLYACVPRLAVLITGGLARASWDPVARRLEPAFDLLMSEPRAAVARGLVAHW